MLDSYKFSYLSLRPKLPCNFTCLSPGRGWEGAAWQVWGRCQRLELTGDRDMSAGFAQRESSDWLYDLKTR